MKILFILTIAAFFHTTQSLLTEQELEQFLATTYEQEASEICTKINNALWDVETDINNEKKQENLLDILEEAGEFDKVMWEKLFKHLDPYSYKNESLTRTLEMLKTLGISILDSDKLKKLTNATTTMTNIYSSAKICPYKRPNCDLNNEGLPLDPDLEEIFAKSRNYDQLLYVWKEWRQVTGAKIKDLYKIYVNLSNEAARANGFDDYGDFWRADYEDTNFVETIDKLWQQIEPLYKELHKYVGYKLKSIYGDKFETDDGLLPAHIFGNMWAQDWLNLADLVRPYPNASRIDVNELLWKRNYTILQMFQTADDFYQSMGLLSNQISYDTSKGAVIEKPQDGREIVCHPSAWDFCDGVNYRIKMCTKVNYEDFITIHHEMGHIQYFLQYQKQPYCFRDGANPGFHEAIGDTMALSVSTPKHLKKIKLLDDYQDDKESVINNLMDMALQKIAFLPFALFVDKWRWGVFNGTIPENKWNSYWWQYREKYQKIKAPIVRSEDDFDAGAKFHIAADSQYIAYFVAHILQFQFYKSLCIEAGEYDPKDSNKPLYNCDFYKSERAGARLHEGLVLGSSQPSQKILKTITGSSEMEATAILEYFQPLYEFLIDYNSKI